MSAPLTSRNREDHPVTRTCTTDRCTRPIAGVWWSLNQVGPASRKRPSPRHRQVEPDGAVPMVRADTRLYAWASPSRFVPRCSEQRSPHDPHHQPQRPASRR